jgi:AI-2E family transporter
LRLAEPIVIHASSMMPTLAWTYRGAARSPWWSVSVAGSSRRPSPSASINRPSWPRVVSAELLGRRCSTSTTPEPVVAARGEPVGPLAYGAGQLDGGHTGRRGRLRGGAILRRPPQTSVAPSGRPRQPLSVRPGAPRRRANRAGCRKLSGTVAVLVALVTQGPVSALIVLGVVIAVQQLEGHVLQPLIMGRAVTLHPLAIVLAIGTGLVVAGIVGALVAVPLLAVANTAVRYLTEHPEGEPSPDREPPGTRHTDDDQAEAEQTAHHTDERVDQETPPPVATSVNPDARAPVGRAGTGA